MCFSWRIGEDRAGLGRPDLQRGRLALFGHVEHEFAGLVAIGGERYLARAVIVDVLPTQIQDTIVCGFGRVKV